MKKKFLTFLLAICFMLPCAFMLTACGGGEKEPEPVSVTIDFAMDSEYYFSSEWEIDAQTNTYTTTYGNAFWSDDMFNVIATTEDGDTRTLQQATEQNPAGYKIDTNIPDESTWVRGIPAGTYTFKLYCDAFNNGTYKTEACEGETYTIIVEKKQVDLTGYDWYYGASDNSYCGDEIHVWFNDSPMGTAYGPFSDMAEYGITNFRYVENETYKKSEVNVGDYVAKIEYDADTANFDYGDTLPPKTFEWSIKKGSLSTLLNLLWYNYDSTNNYNLEYTGDNLITINDLQEFAQRLQGQNNLTLTGVKVNGEDASFPLIIKDIGEYTITPIVTQSDTVNYEDINADPAFSSKYSRTFTVSKKQLTFSDNNVYISDLEYTGEAQNITASVGEDFVVDKYEGTITATNVGTYTVKVYVKVADETKTELVGENYVELTWKILPQQVSFPKWDIDTNWFYGEVDSISDFVTIPNHVDVSVEFADFENGEFPTVVGTYAYTITAVCTDSNYCLEDPQDANNSVETIVYEGTITIEPAWSNKQISITWSYNDGTEHTLGEAETDLTMQHTNFTLSASFDETILPPETTISYLIDDTTTVAYGQPLTFDTVGDYTIKVVFESPNIKTGYFNNILYGEFNLTITE